MFSLVFVYPQVWVSVWGDLCPGGSLSRRVSVRETPPYGKERAVRILLECILVYFCAFVICDKRNVDSDNLQNNEKTQKILILKFNLNICFKKNIGSVYK